MASIHRRGSHSKVRGSKLKRAIALMLKFDLIERPLREFLFKYGAFVGRHPIPFIAVPLLFTIACSVGFLSRTNIIDAVYLFTPSNAPSKWERSIVDQKFPMYNGNYQPDKTVTDKRQCSIIVSASDGGNILRKAYADAVEELNRFVVKTVEVKTDERTYNFTDLCLVTAGGKCYDNAVVPLVNVMYQKISENLTFPMLYLGTQSIYLAGGLGGVQLKYGTNVINSAQAWILVYQLQYFPDHVNKLAASWESEFHKVMSEFSSPLLNVTHFHSQTLNEELKKNAERIVPKFVVTFTVLIAFSIFSSTSLIPGTLYADWILSKPLLAMAGVMNAGMGVATAIGLPSVCGYVYNDIVSVMPILVVSICVEYMFMLTSAWRRTNRVDPLEVRLSETVGHASVSIFIAMLTGCISFAVGTITAIPAVQIFSAYACIAMFCSMIYQFTFFIGAMALFGRLEAAKRHCLFFTKAIPEDQRALVPIWKRMLMLGTVPDVTNRDSPKNIGINKIDRFFTEWYAPVLMNPLSKVLVIIWFLIYLALGLYGCLQLKEGLKPEDLLVSGSYARPHYLNLEKYFWSYGPPVQIIVNNPMNLSTPAGRDFAMSIISDFANTPHTIGNASIQFFLPTFMKYMKNANNYASLVEQKPWLFYKILKNDFIFLNSFAQYRDDIVWGDADRGEDPYEIRAFRFTVGMKDFATSNDQRDTLNLMRHIAAKYPEQNLTTYMYFWMYADQYRVILPNTLENIAIALALMVFISAILIPQPVCAICVAIAIGSIDVGVIGYMTLWGVNLDAISMITIIMSIGFSVDFTAHISYGYVVNDEKDPNLRMQSVLGVRTWPIIQGGLSTIFGMLALSEVDAYIVITFFKTVFLVMVIGVIHAIVFLPVMLSIFIRPTLCVRFIQDITNRSSDNGVADRNSTLFGGHSAQQQQGKNNNFDLLGQSGFLFDGDREMIQRRHQQHVATSSLIDLASPPAQVGPAVIVPRMMEHHAHQGLPISMYGSSARVNQPQYSTVQMHHTANPVPVAAPYFSSHNAPLQQSTPAKHQAAVVLGGGHSYTTMSTIAPYNNNELQPSGRLQSNDSSFGDSSSDFEQQQTRPTSTFAVEHTAAASNVTRQYPHHRLPFQLQLRSGRTESSAPLVGHSRQPSSSTFH